MGNNCTDSCQVKNNVKNGLLYKVCILGDENVTHKKQNIVMNTTNTSTVNSYKERNISLMHFNLHINYSSENIGLMVQSGPYYDNKRYNSQNIAWNETKEKAFFTSANLIILSININDPNSFKSMEDYYHCNQEANLEEYCSGYNQKKSVHIMVLGCCYNEVPKRKNNDVIKFANKNNLYYDFCKNIPERNKAIENFALHCRKIGLLPQNGDNLLQPVAYTSNHEEILSQKRESEIAFNINNDSPGINKKNMNTSILGYSLDSPQTDRKSKKPNFKINISGAVFGDSVNDLSATRNKSKTDLMVNSQVFLEED